MAQQQTKVQARGHRAKSQLLPLAKSGLTSFAADPMLNGEKHFLDLLTEARFKSAFFGLLRSLLFIHLHLRDRSQRLQK
jgi:hypothetical protein